MVFIAPTQHGKSTTIDKFLEVQTKMRYSDTVEDFVIGTGTTSCTKKAVVLPPCPLHYLSYVEWPSDDDSCRQMANKKKETLMRYAAWEDKAHLPEDLSEQLYSLRHEEMLQGKSNYEAKVAQGLSGIIQPTGEEEQDLIVHVIDTPGLDDSDGRSADDDIITGVLELLLSPESPADVAAFVFVAKAGMSWSGSFLASAKRYWEQFPTFRDNWIFVHTGMDAFAEEYADGECFEEACNRRQIEFLDVLKNVFETDLDILETLPHIFVENLGSIDSKRKIYRKKAEFQQMERAKSFNKLVKHLCSNHLKKVQNLEYRKSKDNMELDGTMLQVFEQRRRGVESGLEPLKTLHGRYTDNLVRASEAKQELDQMVRRAQTTLDKYDRNEYLLKAKKTATEDWTFFGAREAFYRLAVPYPKSGVVYEVTKNQGFPTGECEEQAFDWSEKEHKTVLIVKCFSKWMRGYEFDLKLLVHYRLLFHEKIADARAVVALKKGQWEAAKREYEELRNENKTVADEIEVFTRQIEFFGECRFLAMQVDVELSVWKKLSTFYKWARSPEGEAAFRGEDTGNVVIEKFCEVYDMLDQYRAAMRQKIIKVPAQDNL